MHALQAIKQMNDNTSKIKMNTCEYIKLNKDLFESQGFKQIIVLRMKIENLYWTYLQETYNCSIKLLLELTFSSQSGFDF